MEQAVRVEAIGGLMFFSPGAPNGSDIFGAIVRLDSIDATPFGNPFNDDEVIAHTVFNVSSEVAVDETAPLSVDLDPGFYAVLFGNGFFGAEGQAGAPPAGGSLTDNFLVWNRNVQTPNQWTTGSGNARFYVLGEEISPVPLPATAWVFATALGAVGFAGWRKRNT